MPDITMCDNRGCPKRENCYRFTATPKEQQSYAHFEPVWGFNNTAKCDFYWPLRDADVSTASGSDRGFIKEAA